MRETGKERQEVSDGEADAMAIVLDRMMKEDGFVPDFITGISRGAYHLAAKINSMTSKWAKVGYFNIGDDKADPNKKVIKSSSFDHDETLSGVRILVCEDDLRSGLSFIAVREYLEKKGAEIRTMSFFSHPFSKAAPDYIFKKNIEYEVWFPWDNLKQLAKSKSP